VSGVIDLTAVMEIVAEGIRAQGVPCFLDEVDCSPPCVLLRPPALSWRFGQGRYDLSWVALVMVENAGKTAALSKLGELIELTVKGIGAPVLGASPADVQLPDGAAPLPGYSLNWNSKIVM
jgi:hypothetical protein